MCTCHLNRRAAAALLVGAGATLLPGVGRAAEITALGITCMDYRLVEFAPAFFHDKNLTRHYDQVSLAGAALAAVSDKFPESNGAFWSHINIAKQLHHIKKVIVVDHRDCGAYKMILGEPAVKDAETELKSHVKQLYAVRSAILVKHPHMEVEIGLMALDGSVLQIV